MNRLNGSKRRQKQMGQRYGYLQRNCIIFTILLFSSILVKFASSFSSTQVAPERFCHVGNCNIKTSRLSMSMPMSRFSPLKPSLLSVHHRFAMKNKNKAPPGVIIGKQQPKGELYSISDENEQPASTNFQKRVDDILHRLQTLPPLVQLAILISMYVLHLLVFTQHAILFPFQLIPNDRGWFQSIGLDSVAGIISFISIGLLRKRQLNKKAKGEKVKVTIPSLFSGVYDYKIADKFSKSEKKKNKKIDGTDKFDGEDDSAIIIRKKVKRRSSSSIPAPWKFPFTSQDNIPSPRITSMVSLALLVSAYFFTGRLASMIELYLYALAGMGVPMSIAMHRSLVVLGGHLAWVAIGSGILGIVLRPQPFFGGGSRLVAVESSDDDDLDSDNDDCDDNKATEINVKKQKFKWFSNKWNSNWLWWTIGGYFISSWFFNIADFLNQLILPAHVFELAGEGVVSQLINPENNDFAASLVGYIAPCITAPWWEEVLYRGFLLPALTLQMKFWPAVFVSGVVFSVHHVSTTGAIPLAILGWTWAAIYAKSGNLLVTILIHAMWNSRVFLGSWLGL